MHLKINFIYANMETMYHPSDVVYHPILKDAGINWASPLDVIAAASKESVTNRRINPFCFLSDIRGINAYFLELKRKYGERLFSDRMTFESNGKGYPSSQDVSSALNSEFLRRVPNHNHKPSYYMVSPQIEYRLRELAIPTRELVVPAGIKFCDRFACDRDGKLLYRKNI